MNSLDLTPVEAKHKAEEDRIRAELVRHDGDRPVQRRISPEAATKYASSEEDQLAILRAEAAAALKRFNATKLEHILMCKENDRAAQFTQDVNRLRGEREEWDLARQRLLDSLRADKQKKQTCAQQTCTPATARRQDLERLTALAEAIRSLRPDVMATVEYQQIAAMVIEGLAAAAAAIDRRVEEETR